MGSAAIVPPPPPGFTLDAPQSGGVPPPPPGFTLDSPQQAAKPTSTIGPQPDISQVDSGQLASELYPTEPAQQLAARLSMPFIKKLVELHGHLQEMQDMTEAGKAEHPIQAKIGDLANNIEGLLVGNPGHPEASIGTGKYGVLNNPVTSLMALAPAAATAAPEAEEEVVEAAPKIAGAVKKGVQAVKEAIPSAESAGKGFEEVKAAAGSLPVDVTEPEKIAIETQRLSKSGGRMPKVMSDWLKRTEHAGRPLTYNEARDFYSNATRLSSEEYGKLTPVMQRQVARFTDALRKSTADAAAEAGKAEQFEDSMKEFAAAKRMENRKQMAKDLITQAVKNGLKYGTAVWIADKIIRGE